MPRFELETIIEERVFAPGSVIVSLDQPLARVALNLLEPAAPDSLARWGFFNAVFEEKEYAEHYVLEELARQMIRNDPSLADEFVRAIAEDPELASNPAERLRFFYKRSPYWDPQMNLSPVGRVLVQ